VFHVTNIPGEDLRLLAVRLTKPKTEGIFD
jgi:hypothetical protein